MALKESKNRLERLNQISKLFVFPLIGLLTILAVDIFFTLFGIEKGSELGQVRVFFQKIILYLFPIILLSVVAITFYSSYKILESRNWKNFLIFILIQGIALFIFNEVGLEIPRKSDKKDLILYTILVTFIIVLILKIPALFVKLGKKRPSRPGTSNALLGLLVSAIFSIIIASMIHLRVGKENQFISWGIFFGICLSLLMIKGEKMMLGLFYFLDPRSAEYLFKLHNLKHQVQDEKFKKEIFTEEEELMQQKYKNELLALAKKLDKIHTKVKYENYRTEILNYIERAEDYENLEPKDRLQNLEKMKTMIEILKSGEELELGKYLTEGSREEFSLEEKVMKLMGLNETEIIDALKEGLIREDQKYFWVYKNQYRVRNAIKDFDEDQYTGESPVLIADSFKHTYSHNSPSFKKFLEIITSPSFNPIALEKIRGAEHHNLLLLKFKTVVKEFAAVLKIATDGATYLLHSIIEM